VWGVFSFDNDEWPATSNTMWMCVGLNIGVYIVWLLILLVIAWCFPHIMSWYYAHFAILESIRKLPPRYMAIQNPNTKRRHHNEPPTPPFKATIDN
tara:strand:+ start:185 stop:472 length:288 start_codon:yes stop_codon:yes gene_type:complete